MLIIANQPTTRTILKSPTQDSAVTQGRMCVCVCIHGDTAGKTEHTTKNGNVQCTVRPTVSFQTCEKWWLKKENTAAGNTTVSKFMHYAGEYTVYTVYCMYVYWLEFLMCVSTAWYRAPWSTVIHFESHRWSTLRKLARQSALYQSMSIQWNR